MTDFKDIKARKKSRITKVQIQLDGTAASKLENLRTEYREAQIQDSRVNEPDKAPGIARKIERLIERSKDSVADFTFRAIGRIAFDEMMAAHPPRKEDKEINSDWNVDTFPPALVAASSVDPKISEEDAVEIWASPDWNNGELMKIWLAALEANTVAGDIPFGQAATGPISSIDKKSTSASSEESPEALSSDE